jgi:phosphopantothenoylcysteine decarboxylase/phosphopantothenate--cysteine ligase
MSIEGRKILVGVGGGIAAFKSVELVRILRGRGAEVRVAMTPAATRFVGPMTFAAVTGSTPAVDLFDPAYPGEIHVELGHWAEAVVVAPATADLMARAAAGMANDVLLAALLCSSCPVFYAPAMHERMWLAPGTKRNVEQLGQDGAVIIGPVRGPLADGRQGMGRMEEPGKIADAIERDLGAARDLEGRKVLVSAGPTLEDIDPVRFIGNRSSGRMGYAVARRAQQRGADVVLVTGPVELAPPPGVQTVLARSAREMQRAVYKHKGRVDAIVMTAAVADYRPASPAKDKIKKREKTMSIELVRNPDILADLGRSRKGRRPVLVGFAMETGDPVAYAKRKLVEKKVDLMVANEAAVGFGRDDTQAALVARDGVKRLPPMSKAELADRILDRVRKLLGKK